MSRPRGAIIAVFVLASLLLAGPLGAAPARASRPAATAVVNGEEAVPGSFPYLAFVFFREGGEGEACTGTVVSSNVVLTAAHCVLDEALGVVRSPVGFRVVTGDVEWEAPDRVVSSVSAVAIDPEYTPSGGNAHWADAAVLQLSRPIAAAPVRLATSEAWAPGTTALLAGWGKLSVAESGPSPVLHYGTTAVQSPAYCTGKANHFNPAGQLCVLDAAAHLSSACSGDSGGPLLVVAPGTTNEPLQVGIASYIVTEDCAPTSPQYFTRADLVAPWVAAEIAALAPSPGAVPAAVATSVSGTHQLPWLGGRRAKSFVRSALARSFGRAFEKGRSYRAECETLEAAKRSCAVSWRVGGFEYAGWVTVFYALDANEVVWRYSMRVRRRAATASEPVAGQPRSPSAADARGRNGRR